MHLKSVKGHIKGPVTPQYIIYDFTGGMAYHGAL